MEPTNWRIIMSDKFKKTKKWIKDYKEELAVTGMVAAIVAVYGGLVYVAIKAAKAQEEEDAARMLALGEAVARGASVLPGPDGEYWIIEAKG
jgi:glycine cleavage system H lipoate-binding protein